MLASFKMTHLVLVEHCAIDFENGLTIISGETGSGKTVLVHAIALALGERADPALIRQGEEKAIIEIAFDLPTHHPVFSILADAGIAVDVEDFLFRSSLTGRRACQRRRTLTSTPSNQASSSRKERNPFTHI